MKASEYLSNLLIASKIFEAPKVKLAAMEIVKNQKITAICENSNENILWSNNIGGSKNGK